MHLTLRLCLFKLPNGHIFRGKDRLVKRVTEKAVETLKKDYEREEANMLYLRYPYLSLLYSPNRTLLRIKTLQRIICKDEQIETQKSLLALIEQSSGHAKALKKREKWRNKFVIAAKEKFSKHRTLEDELSHLKVTENWEFEAGSRV